MRRTAGANVYLHRDSLDSVRRVTDASGNLNRAAVYKPYGTQVETVIAALSPTEPKGWIGERTDPETGLTYLHARSYDAAPPASSPPTGGTPIAGINKERVRTIEAGGLTKKDIGNMARGYDVASSQANNSTTPVGGKVAPARQKYLEALDDFWENLDEDDDND